MPKNIGGIIMLSKIRALKEKKGFTLVELIVVLVILAILAALLVPALTGYIDRANNEKIIAETRSAVMAAQTIASEEYAKNTTSLSEGSNVTVDGASTAYTTAIKNLAEVSGTVTSVSVSSGKVTSLTYSGTKTCTYTKTGDSAGSYSVAK
jgi:type IV pilus assembly protein PilA